MRRFGGQEFRGRYDIRSEPHRSAFQCHGKGSSDTRIREQTILSRRGVLKLSADSDIRFEVWLPPESAWNGKYQGIGNGGFAGSLIYRSMDRSLEADYAVSGTDTGHSGGPLDSAWALGHPEKILDFGWRAIHETAVASKAIIEAYYGELPVHAYFSGCSNGGREALMEAQRFPRDYDGIVAGAPAIVMTAGRRMRAHYWPSSASATFTRARIGVCPN